MGRSFVSREPCRLPSRELLCCSEDFDCWSCELSECESKLEREVVEDMLEQMKGVEGLKRLKTAVEDVSSKG